MLLYTINLNCHCDFNLSLPPSLAPPFLFCSLPSFLHPLLSCSLSYLSAVYLGKCSVGFTQHLCLSAPVFQIIQTTCLNLSSVDTVGCIILGGQGCVWWDVQQQFWSLCTGCQHLGMRANNTPGHCHLVPER